MEHTICICKHKVVGTWGPWQATAHTHNLTPWGLKKNIRQIKCQAAVSAARRRVRSDEEFLQGGDYKEEECED